MKALIAAAILSLFLSIPSFAGKLMKIDNVLGTKELCITDGSSIYIFSPDNKFRLVPKGMSGRTIEGTWSQGANGIRIEGKWSWINGISIEDDYREMDIQLGYVEDVAQDFTSMVYGSKHKVYKCYLIIDRLEKKAMNEIDDIKETENKPESKLHVR